MLQELTDESKNQGLKINKSKTKVMMENDMSTTLRSRTLNVTWNRGTTPETKTKIQRRDTAGWTVFAKHRDIFEGNIGTCLKRQVYNSCVLPAMTYGAETWALTTQAKNKLAAAQTKIERSILNITYRD